MATYPLTWDQVGEKLYETGTDHAVVYPYDETAKAYGNGVAWNGITGYTDSPSGADETALWADNIKYASMRAAEEYGGTITCYTYPDEFAECDGSAFVMTSGGSPTKTGISLGQQKRKSFGFTVRTLVGNDTSGNDYGYKLHLVYGASVSPSDKDYSTVNDSPDAIEFSYEFTTTPVPVGTAYKPTAHMTLDTTKMDSTALGHLAELEAILYGTGSGGLLIMSGAKPADWPTNSTPSTSYFKLAGVTSSDSYSANTYYKASGSGTYVKITDATAPEDWPEDSTPSTKYFKATGVTVSDVYAANTYYQVGPTPASIPSRAEVSRLVGGSPDVVNG